MSAARIAVIVPVLNRPQNAQPLADSLKASGANAILWFVCSPGDDAQIEASDKAALVMEMNGSGSQTVNWKPGQGDWARKINHVVCEDRHAVLPPDECEFLLLGADDLRFHPGWDTEALKVADNTGAGVIGTNDLCNPVVMRGQHSTHSLVRRSYIEENGTIDEPGKVLHEGYWHNWCDNELVETAMSRRQWAFAPRSRVEHLHPMKGRSPMDDTYRLGMQHFREDRNLLIARRPLWRNALVRGQQLEGRGVRMASRRGRRVR